MFWLHPFTWAVALTPTVAAQPLDVGHGKQLFLDGMFTAEANGVTLTVGPERPVRAARETGAAALPDAEGQTLCVPVRQSSSVPFGLEAIGVIGRGK